MSHNKTHSRAGIIRDRIPKGVLSDGAVWGGEEKLTSYFIILTFLLILTFLAIQHNWTSLYSVKWKVAAYKEATSKLAAFLFGTLSMSD